MDTIASQITSLAIVYSIVYSSAVQRKHQSSASLAFVWGIHRSPVNSPHKGPVTRKMHLMTSSCKTKIQMCLIWAHLHIKMPFDQCRDSYYKDKTVSRLYYLYNGNSHTWKYGSSYWDGALGPGSISDKTSYPKISWSLEAARSAV